MHDEVVRLRNLGSRSAQVAELFTSPSGFTEADLADTVGAGAARLLIDRLSQLLIIHPLVEQQPPPPEHLIHQTGYLEAMSAEPGMSQQRIRTAKVAIIGLGGIGGLVLQHLLGAGVRQFLLVDGDVVAPANLNRQFLFTPADIGRLKVDAARECVSRYPDAHAEVRPTFIGGTDELAGEFVPDFVVCAADSPPGLIVRWTAAYAAKHAAGFISCGVGINRGYWGPVIVPGETRCLACARPDLRDGPADRPAPLAVSFSPVNSMVAAGVAADMLWTIGRLRPIRDIAVMKVLNLTRASLDSIRPSVAAACDDSLCNSRVETPS
ncbi:hypothetical protein Nm8I071_55250 [Nonomuraea sp. TT08I-71]|nr:hypothetical protein Nm8I071_55250 [Nonomuraea sp. TT08I-71]